MARPTRITQAMIDEYTQKGYWQWVTPVDLFEQCVEKHPNKEFLVDSKVRLTWEQAKKQADRIALGLLQLGMKRDEVIVMMLPNCAEWVLFWLGCQKAGIISLPLMMTLRHEELKSILRPSEAKGIVIPKEYRNFDYYEMAMDIIGDLPGLKHILVTGDETPKGAVSVKQITEDTLEARFPVKDLRLTGFKADETMQLVQTSGTTALPKITESISFSWVAAAKLIVKRYKLTQDEVIFPATPLAGGPGISAFRSALLASGRVVLLERFEVDEALNLVEREKITGMTMVPTILMRLGAHPDLEKYDLRSLRYLYNAGAPLPFNRAMEIEKRIGAPILNIYGAVDWGGLATPYIDDPPEIRLGTVGQPFDGNEFKLLDEAGNEVPQGQAGLVVGRGPHTSAGYFKDDKRTFEMWDKDGWGATGDIARFDGMGNMIIVGRQKDMIIRGGQNIYPSEIENMLLVHPRVSNVAIVGMPDPEMGEKACAFVIPKAGQEFSFDDMISYLKGKHIAPFKLPQRLEIVDSFPLVGADKIDKKSLVTIITNRLEAEGTLSKS
ncbi:AMP-binding protein [Chloroflexota bacterium]